MNRQRRIAHHAAFDRSLGSIAAKTMCAVIAQGIVASARNGAKCVRDGS
jgi:hypothetical protein